MPLHLAQVNIACMRDTIDSETMRTMRERIDEMNRLAEASPGFVWRFIGEPTLEELQILEHMLGAQARRKLFFNMSVWQSIEALEQYVFRTAHIEMFKRKKEWMEKSDAPSLAM